MFKLNEITKVLRDGIEVTVHEASSHDVHLSKKMYRAMLEKDEDKDIADGKSAFCYVSVRTSRITGGIQLADIADSPEQLKEKFRLFWTTLPEKLAQSWADYCYAVSSSPEKVDPKPQGNSEKDSATTSQP